MIQPLFPILGTRPQKRVSRYGACLILLGILAALPSGSDAELHNDRWRWSNPLPHGNNVLDMFVTSDLSVQVGDAGSLYVQRSDERWAPAVTGVSNYLRSTTIMGSRIIATGESGCILWSDDGIVFEQAQLSPLNSLDWFEGVDASTQTAVAVGDFGTIYSSINGSEWVAASSGTTEWLRGVAFGGGGFVAVGENGTILRGSVNGISWTAIASGVTGHLNRVRYLGSGGNSRFYAVGNAGLMLSSVDGSLWTALASGTTNDLFDVALNNSGLLLVGDQEIRMSPDGGATWTEQINPAASNAPPAWTYLSAHGQSDSWLVAGRSGLLMEGSCTNGSDCIWQPSPDFSSHAWLWDMTVQNGIYIAVGDLANIKTSLDGILWAREVVPVSHTNTVLLGVGGTSNLLLAVGNDGNVLLSESGLQEMSVTNTVDGVAVITNILVETFGVVWTNIPAFTTNSLQGVAATDNLFIVAGEAGRVFTSSNGWNWQERTSPATSFLSSVAIGAAGCVAVGENGTLLHGSADGSVWTVVPLGTTDWLYRVRWLEDRFVVVGENGTLFSSPDGLNWTELSSGSTRWLTDVSFVDGQWFICGYQGELLSSTNLADWAELPVPTGKSLFAAATQGGQLVLAGIEGVTLRNQVIPETSPVLLLDYSLQVALDTNAVSSVYELFLFGGKPDQFFDFQSSTNLVADSWTNNASLEIFDPSGTIYAIRTRDATNTPPAEYYRTQLTP